MDAIRGLLEACRDAGITVAGVVKRPSARYFIYSMGLEQETRLPDSPLLLQVLHPGERTDVFSPRAALQQARVRLGLPAEGSDDHVVTEQTSLVRQARAVLEEAQLTRDRMQRLWQEGGIARAQLDAAVAALAVAEGRYQDALEEVRTRQAVLRQRRSELALARQQMADTRIIAPVDGAVSERRVSVGEFQTDREVASPWWPASWPLTYTHGCTFVPSLRATNRLTTLAVALTSKNSGGAPSSPLSASIASAMAATSGSWSSVCGGTSGSQMVTAGALSVVTAEPSPEEQATSRSGTIARAAGLTPPSPRARSSAGDGCAR